MNSSKLKEALLASEMLDEILRKKRATYALNEFINTQIDATKHAIQPLTEDIKLSSVKSAYEKSLDNDNHTSLVTNLNEEGVIRTEEMSNVPFPFVQSETLLYPDNRKVINTFYPHYEKIISKKVEYSADRNSVATTTFDRDGNKKVTFSKTINSDGTRIEENIEHKYNKKEIKKFSKYNLIYEIENYIDNRLKFKLECDQNGNIKRESHFYSMSPVQTLRKEVVYISNTTYMTKEYDYNGKIISSQTTNVKK